MHALYDLVGTEEIDLPDRSDHLKPDAGSCSDQAGTNKWGSIGITFIFLLVGRMLRAATERDVLGGPAPTAACTKRIKHTRHTQMG